MDSPTRVPGRDPGDWPDPEIYGTPEGERFYQLLRQQGAPFAEYFLPLIQQDEVIAVLQLTKYAEGTLKLQQAEFLSAVASQLSVAVANALEHRAVVASRDQLAREQVSLREEIDRSSMFEEIVGASESLRTVLSQVARVAPAASTVLILGETGTGKELMARAIHKRSPRAARAFVPVSAPTAHSSSRISPHRSTAPIGRVRASRRACATRSGARVCKPGSKVSSTFLGDAPDYAFRHSRWVPAILGRAGARCRARGGKKIFDGYAEAGGNFIDTADGYQDGQAEVLVGEFMAAERDHFVLATKYTLGVETHAGLAHTGNSRKNMLCAVEASLKRLKTDRIDLYWVHMADGVTPTEEIMRGFDDLVRAGKILYAGLSNFPAWRIARAVTLAEWHGWAPITGVQIEYSLVERTPDRELLPMAESLGLGAALWSPLGGGFLTGKYRAGEAGRLQGLGTLVHTEKTARETAVLDAVLAVADELHVPPTHVAIAWLLHRALSSTTSLIPILGSRTRAQFDAMLGALDVTLSPAQIARLDTSSAIPLGVPHDIIRDNAARLAGGKLAQVDIPAMPVA